MPDLPDVTAALDAGAAIAGAEDFGDGIKALVIPTGYRLETIDLYEATTAPRRKTGDYTVDDPDSFIAYIDRHITGGTEVYASESRRTIAATIDGHLPTTAGFQDHTLTYTAQPTPEWTEWIQNNGQWMGQEEFAELVEDRAPDIVRPTAADMLELAQTFVATKAVAFKSGKQLSTGERELEYRETVEASAGRAGRLTIPPEFDLALRPFVGADAYKVTARLRYRIIDEHLRLAYKLNRPEDVVREAFAGVVDTIQEGIAAPVFMGARR